MKYTSYHNPRTDPFSLLRRKEERRDNEAANRALQEKGANIPWPEARKRLGWT